MKPSIFWGMAFLFFSYSLSADKMALSINNKIIAVYGEHKTFRANPDTTRAIIIIHGKLRKVDASLKVFRQLLAERNTAQKVLLLSPKFKTLEDEPALDEMYWSESGWKIGESSKDGSNLSSFTVVDELVAQLADKDRYPNLKEIYISGHSAGGQFVQRYAMLSNTPNKYKKYDFKFFVLNPSSYIYLDKKRPVPSKENEFVSPYHKKGPWRKRFRSLVDAPGFNHYKYGLDELVPYVTLKKKKILKYYGQRQVYYGVGTEDTGDDMLDMTPPAMLQGQNRYERAKNYFYRLNQIYDNRHKHELIEVPGVAHDGKGMIEALEERLIGGLQ